MPIICMYGVTMDGNSVAAYVHGFSPYFYIPAGQGFHPDDCAAFRVISFFVYKMVKTGQFTTKCKGDRVIALKRQKSLWWDSA